MKLLHCYIENFGGLQQYAVSFGEGLTVICEPNGFGKTTLAEFIRAMFYGFPRANKDLNKNPRLKYLPWQGGRYGGYLIFEHNGKRYRIDRSFGENPRSDKFKLYDEATGLESRDYTSDIGSELFGLDSDSFLRSTYMPQIRDGGALSTDNIRAKLGNLIEDTGDIGSFERALQRLREKRTTYEHFRGSGGSIHELSRRMTLLQKEIADCSSKSPLLDRTTEEIEALTENRALGEAALADIRTQLTAATTAQAEAALFREYEALLRRTEETEQALAALTARYPLGFPTQEELEEALRMADRGAALEAAPAESPADKNAAHIAETQAERFARGIPTQEDFAAGEAQYDAYTSARSALAGSALTEEEQTRLHNLELQFRSGTPDHAWFTDCRSKQAELTQLHTARNAMTLSPEDNLRLQALGSFFAEGLPEQAELDSHRQQLERAEELRRENLRLASAMPPEQEAAPVPKKLHSLFLPALVLGILAAAAGIWTLAAAPAALQGNHLLIGGIASAVAVIAMIAGCFLQISHNLNTKLQQNTLSGMTAAQRSLMEENEAAARTLETAVAAFTGRFPFTEEATLQHRLSDIQTNRALYLPLRARAKQMEGEAADTDCRIARLSEALTEALTPYFVTIPPFETALGLLEARALQYTALLEKQAALQARKADLTTQLHEARQQLETFLLPYCPHVTPDGFREALSELRRDAERYDSARTHVAQRQQMLAQRDKELAQLRQATADLAARYGLQLPFGDRQKLQTVSRDRDTVPRLERDLQQAQTALDRFLAEHGPKTAPPPMTADPNALKIAERDLITQQTALASRLVQLNQNREQLRTELDRIPMLTDELTRCTEQKAADTHSRQLLDQTIDYLQQARQSLSSGYLGGVQGHFTKYLSRLTGEAAGRIGVTPDLEVSLERAGSPRALTHFSAGQSDAVHLCMRLALADALFEAGDSFMILDDPFVNLDDTHTAQALELLQELAQDRQIIYLVCNSSRKI